MRLCLCVTLLLFFYPGFNIARAQDRPGPAFASKLLEQVNKKAARIQEKLSRQTARYLARLEKQEKKLKAKLQQKDSTAAKEVFGDVAARYKSLNQTIPGKNNVYVGALDSSQTALKFLQQNNLIDQDKIQPILQQYSSLQEKFNQTEQVKKLLNERTKYLKDQLKKFGMVKEFRGYQKQLYYYRSQVNEYKQLLEEPTKLETKLLSMAMRLPAFREFFNKHSALAGMFRLPQNEPSAPIAGLQTRTSVQQLLESRFGTGPDVNRAMQQNMQSAQQQLNQIKEKITSLGSSGADLDLPGFKPNSYKTKSFWQRIELGTNFQSTRSTNYFPVTSDLGLSAGYKLNERSIIGLGASYKMGWGAGIRHVRLTHEGAGLRSFIDWKLKGSFYVSGGFEYNYQQPYSSLRQLYEADNWQKSGLLGVSKVISVQSKFFKKTKLQLLWDFLSYDQVPRAQPLKFRMGYSFN